MKYQTSDELWKLHSTYKREKFNRHDEIAMALRSAALRISNLERENAALKRAHGLRFAIVMFGYLRGVRP